METKRKEEMSLADAVHDNKVHQLDWYLFRFNFCVAAARYSKAFVIFLLSGE